MKGFYLDKEEVVEIIKEIVENHSLYNRENVQFESQLKEDHGIDSLKIVELIIDLEDELKIKFESNALTFENLKSVESIYYYVLKAKKWGN